MWFLVSGPWGAVTRGRASAAWDLSDADAPSLQRFRMQCNIPTPEIQRLLNRLRLHSLTSLWPSVFASCPGLLRRLLIEWGCFLRGFKARRGEPVDSRQRAKGGMELKGRGCERFDGSHVGKSFGSRASDHFASGSMMIARNRGLVSLSAEETQRRRSSQSPKLLVSARIRVERAPNKVARSKERSPPQVRGGWPGCCRALALTKPHRRLRTRHDTI